jgi:hypothetical protein
MIIVGLDDFAGPSTFWSGERRRSPGGIGPDISGE